MDLDMKYFPVKFITFGLCNGLMTFDGLLDGPPPWRGCPSSAFSRTSVWWPLPRSAATVEAVVASWEANGKNGRENSSCETGDNWSRLVQFWTNVATCLNQFWTNVASIEPSLGPILQLLVKWIQIYVKSGPKLHETSGTETYILAWFERRLYLSMIVNTQSFFKMSSAL